MELVEILEAINEQLPWKSETDKTALSEKIKALDPNYVKPEEPAEVPAADPTPEADPEEIVNSSSSQIGDATGAGATGENETPAEVQTENPTSDSPADPGSESNPESSLAGE